LDVWRGSNELAPFGAPPPFYLEANLKELCRRGVVVCKLGRGARRENEFLFVIAGLDPAIHAEGRIAYAAWFLLRRFCMDQRVKPGGDEGSGGDEG
jgi:hypothetical protein